LCTRVLPSTLVVYISVASVECRFQFDDFFLYVLLKRLDVANTRISKLLA
jgi:hypothetical protein